MKTEPLDEVKQIVEQTNELGEKLSLLFNGYVIVLHVSGSCFAGAVKAANVDREAAHRMLDYYLDSEAGLIVTKVWKQ